MKYLKQFLIIIAVTFVGELLKYVIPLPIPASIYGLLIMFILLATKILPLNMVKETGDFLVKIMPVMFIPAAAGLIVIWADIKGIWLSLIVITVVTTILVMAVSGKVTQAIIRRSRIK